VAAAICLTGSAAAQSSATDYRWEELQRQSRLSAGTVLPPESGQSFHRLRIDGTASPTHTTVLTLESPRISSSRYVLIGQVRYEGVDGTGYLEMWNYFPGGGQYFTRTLADAGPMMKLRGTSGWRPLALPFDATGEARPSRLVVSVVLEGRGTVYLSDLMLQDQSQAAGSGQRGTIDRLVGAASVAGTVVGFAGAMIGVLTSLGRARKLVVTLAVTVAVVGGAMCLLGIAVFASGGSPSASAPLLLVGILGSVLPLVLLPTIRRRYQDIELRTMRAHDVA
jgi:hypothetical protein